MTTRAGWLWAIYVVLFLAFTAASGVRHDYIAYLTQWSVVMEGRDPWFSEVDGGRNAYGPLHLLFAPLAALHPLLPKLLTAALWLAALDRVVRIVLAADRPPAIRAWLLAILLLNPFLWIWVGAYGSNDAVVAGLLTLVLAGALEGRRGLRAGIAFGLAALLKVYPVFVLPFVATVGRRIRWWMAATALAILVGAWALAWAIWGDTALIPLTFASTRRPRLLSLASFLSDSVLVPGPSHRKTVGRIAPYVFAAVGLACFAWYWWRGDRSAVHGATVALLVILAGYHLGQFQFYIPFIPAAVLLMATDRRVTRAPAIALVSIIAAVSALGTLYAFTGGLRDEGFLFLRVEAGGLMFLLDAWALGLLLLWPRAPRQSSAI